MRRAPGLGAEPWVEELLPSILEAIGDYVNPAYAPKWDRKRQAHAQYGCGYYGCVMPTETDGVVLKLTTDLLEAQFVTNVLLGDQDITRGLVRYHAIREVQDLWPHPGRNQDVNVWAIWREEVMPWNWGTRAMEVSLRAPLERIREPSRDIVNAYLNAIHRDGIASWFELLGFAAREENRARARMRHVPNRDRYMAPWVQFTVDMPDRDRAFGLAQLLVYLDQELRALPKRPLFYDAMRTYYEHGWIFADVRGDNLGFRPATAEMVIADPGLAVPLREEAIDLYFTHQPPLLGKGRY